MGERKGRRWGRLCRVGFDEEEKKIGREEDERRPYV